MNILNNKKPKIVTCLILFLVLQFQTNAQEILSFKGKIIDEKTEEPVVFSNIFYPIKSLGFVTNNDGEFSFTLNATLNDSITISHLSYKPVTITIEDFFKLKDGVVKLKASNIVLKEVVVINKKSSEKNANDLMRKLYEAFKKSRPKLPHIAEAYFREKGRYNGVFVFFNESVGYSIFLGNRRDAAAFSNYKFFPENTRMSNLHPIWNKKMKEIDLIRNRVGKKEILSSSDNVNQYRRFEYGGPLSKNYKKFNCKIDSSYVQNGLHYYNISFDGKRFKGAISFCENNFHITKVEYETTELFSTPFDTLMRGNVSIAFNYFDNVPFVSKIETNYTFQKLSHQNTLLILAQKTKGFKLSSDQYWAFNTYAANPFLEYIPEKWKSLKIGLDNEYDIVSKDLFLDGKSIEQQFKLNSGKWVNEMHIQQGNIAIFKIKDLKNNF